MELRSHDKNQLVELLKVTGAYEDGMEIEEMRQVAQAMEMSVMAGGSAECSRIERALLESESDFQMLLNSTMIAPPTRGGRPSPTHEVYCDDLRFQRDCESPAGAPIQMQVQALVHHELNWSPPPPPGGRPLLKREASAVNMELNSKRLHQAESGGATPLSLSVSDSGVSSDNEVGSLSSVSDCSTQPSIGEMPSLLLISTSSAAVSDCSEREPSSSFIEP
ncbi:hypothetical protein KR222_011184 [Zaprionus bogoriensis]|nr:hypothetical protein KR222_011184 [Zaprionus bogoriensis]